VSDGPALLRAFCQWKVEQVRKRCVKGLILSNMAGRESDTARLHDSGYVCMTNTLTFSDQQYSFGTLPIKAQKEMTYVLEI